MFKLPEVRITVPPNVITHLNKVGKISDEEYKKYMLSEDPSYIPPLIKE